MENKKDKNWYPQYRKINGPRGELGLRFNALISTVSIDRGGMKEKMLCRVKFPAPSII